MDKVYISYSSDDRQWASVLADKLQIASITVVCDKTRLLMPRPYEDQLFDLIRDSTALLILWSRNIRNMKGRWKDWVITESAYFRATHPKAPIVYLLLDDTRPDIDIKDHVFDINGKNFPEEMSNADWDQIINKIRKAVLPTSIRVDASVPSHAQLHVFLCHASQDKPPVRELYKRLQADGFDPWLDEEKILPGQNWQLEIASALRRSDAVLVCLSQASTRKIGFVQKEIKDVLDLAELQPEEAIFIIPVRLDDCDVPNRLKHWQWVDYFGEGGYERLRRSLEERIRQITPKVMDYHDGSQSWVKPWLR
ncbi:MAG: hypothetical protein H6R26_294 [Proteobacteria bacterium]|nr:hypothetical protein [Pseudomonadota bacterium]